MTNRVRVLLSYENREMLLHASDNPSDQTGIPVSRGLLETGFYPVANRMRTFIEETERLRPETVLVDLYVEKTSAMAILKEVRRRMGTACPAFVVLMPQPLIRMEREFYEAGAAAVITGAFQPEMLFAVLCTVGNERFRDVLFPGMAVRRRRVTVDTEELELLVTDLIHQMGVPAHIKGYYYLRQAIMTAVQDPGVLDAVTKQLYPQIAECFMTTPPRVERAIRHAIEVAWSRGDIETLQYYFGSTSRRGGAKPTNSEFVAVLADKLRVGLLPVC